MSIDFGKFKKKPEVEHEIAEEKVSDKMSDKYIERESDRSDNPPTYSITSDQLRAIYVLITGRSNRNYTKKTLTNKIIEILTNAE